MSEGKLIFVYGTLKRGGSNHAHLDGENFIGEARTAPGFRLVDLGGYPGMVAKSDPKGEGVLGEVWCVNATALGQLDDLEGLAEGLYRREIVPLQPPFADRAVEAYLYARPVEGRREIGSRWEE